MAEKHPVRGVLAGIAGGLVAAWVMNQWSAGPGAALSKQLETPEEQQQMASGGDDDATIKTAVAIASEGGTQLTEDEKKIAGPVVHYTYAALAGGLYGGLAEYSSIVRSGFGTTYATALFVGGDLVAVPALHLSKPLAEYPAASYAGPFSAHIVYGLTTELMRRLVRSVL